MNTENIPQNGETNGKPFQREPNLRQHILVVDDDAAIRRVNSEVLLYSGYQADAAGDGKAAWDVLQLIDYDLMVTDNDMPKVTGIELIQKLRAAGRMMPVIMATGVPPDEELIHRQLIPPTMMLIKPYTFDELLSAVKIVLRTTSDSLGEMAPPPNWQIQPLADRRWL